MVLPKKYWKTMMKKKKEKEIMISSKKTTTRMDIPNDLIIEIFLRLPPQSLLRSRWVCKSWFNLIRDPSFVYMQLNNNISHKPNNNPSVLIYTYNGIRHNLKLISYNTMDIENDHTCPNSLVSVEESFNGSYQILGSCNGLLCIGVRTCDLVRERYFIWNPCTKEYKKASRRILTANDCCYGNNYAYYYNCYNRYGFGYDCCYYNCYNRYGFGYDRTIDDYKLVKTTMSTRCNGNPETWVYVYTLGTNTWKTVRSTYQFILCNTHEEANINGLFISGYLYYTAKKTSSRTFDIIVSFDIAKEEYRQIPIPDIRADEFCPCPVMNLGELKGCLCLLGTSTVCIGLWEVWMMRHNVENNIDVKEEYTWEKLRTINNSAQGRSWHSLSTKLLMFCKNGEILMVMGEFSYRKKIVLYDPKSGEITVLHEVKGSYANEGSLENHIESLVSLNSGTYTM